MTSAPVASSSSHASEDAICSIVLVSDTHGRHNELMMPTSGCNVLICAGDFTRFGRKSDAIDFNDWLGEQPMAHKLVVLGNHEANAEWVDAASSILSNATLLRDQTVRLPNGLAVHGTEGSLLLRAQVLLGLVVGLLRCLLLALFDVGLLR